MLLLRALQEGGFEPIYTLVETAEELLTALKDKKWQLVISDHSMPNLNSFKALAIFKESGRDLPFIIVSGTIGEEAAVEAMRSGAHDYIFKGNLSRLAPAVERELRDAEIRRQSKANSKQLEYLTLHDLLTGLYNRIYFKNELERLEGGREYPIIILSADLDNLRLINDTLGQKEGDRILKVCAEMLEKPLCKGDVLARVGSDEFIAILPRAVDRTGDEILRQIRNEVDTYNRTSKKMPISISLGYAVSKDQSEHLEATLNEANNMMQLDKKSSSESVRSQVVSALLAALSERDYISGGHAERLKKLCLKVGEEVGLDQQHLSALTMVAQVHDLGKVGIPDSILFKEGPLTEKEWAIMHQHTEKGYRIARSSPELIHVANLILYHHEKWNGRGYPQGLQGNEIPIECRILAIVDAYDAMTTDRPYSQAKSKQEALEEIKRNAGTQFDPLLAEIFINII